jgi:hypothetical protein
MLDLRTLRQTLGGEISSGSLRCPGPGHSAADRSLSVKLDNEAPEGFLVHSFAGDDPIICRDYVRTKAGLPAFKPNGGNGRRRATDDAIERALMEAVQGGAATSKPKGRLVATFGYVDENAQLLYQVLKYDPKNFRQRRPDGNGGWTWSLGDVRRVLYRWPELLQYPDATVFVCEGEKDADRVASLGHCATCVAAGTWTEDCVKALAGRDCIVLQDNDGPGHKKALAAAQALHGTAKSIRIVLLPGLPEKGDVSDWLDADPRRSKELVDICFGVPVWAPESDANGIKDAAEETAKDDGDAEEQEQTEQRVIQSSAEFIRSYIPPDYLIEGLLQRQFFYSLTGKTGAGKTAIALLFAALVALGRDMDGRQFERGRVLYLAGENPVDAQQRWIAMSQQMDFDGYAIDVHFIPGVFKVSKMESRIAEEVKRLDGVSLVVIDTTAAYFEGDDENSNVQAGEYARMQRRLIKSLLGGPTILALCHPVKNATEDNLLPRGGGSYLNETDGNLTVWNNDGVVELHWQGKFRGGDFAPISFQMRKVTHELLKDSKGRLISTVVAGHLSETGEKELRKVTVNNEDAVLRIVAQNKGVSYADIATLAGWINKDNRPNKAASFRYVKSLIKDKLVKKGRNGLLELTEAGKKAFKDAEGDE